MKKTLLSLLLLASFFISRSQSNYFNVSETATFKDIKKHTDLLSVHQLGGDLGVATVRAIRKDYVLSYFDKNYSLKANIEFETEKKEHFVGSVVTKGEVRIFTSHKIDKEHVDIYAWTFHPQSKKLSKTKLYTQKTGKRKKGSFFGWFDPVNRKYNENFRVSPDGNYLAFSLDNFNGKERVSAVRVFNEKMEEVFTKNYLEEAEQAYNFDDFLITNNGVVLTAGKLYKKGTNDKRNGKANYDYALYRIDGNGSVSNIIDLGENFIQELRFVQSNDAIRLMGFYSERNSSRMKGGVSFVFNEDDIQNVKPVTTPFPKSVFKDIYTEAKSERLKKKEKELSNYYLDYSFVDEEGNGYLTAEEFYVTTQYIANANGGGTTTTIYHYDNILVIKFDETGKLLWGRSILKQANRPSYNALVMDEKVHLFLNSGKNIGEKSDGRKKLKKSWFEKSALFDVVFDENGEQTYEMIKENDGRKDFFSPIRGNWDYGTFLMPNFSKSKKQFLVLTEK